MPNGCPTGALLVGKRALGAGDERKVGGDFALLLRGQAGGLGRSQSIGGNKFEGVAHRLVHYRVVDVGIESASLVMLSGEDGGNFRGIGEVEKVFLGGWGKPEHGVKTLCCYLETRLRGLQTMRLKPLCKLFLVLVNQSIKHSFNRFDTFHVVDNLGFKYLCLKEQKFAINQHKSLYPCVLDRTSYVTD